MNRLLLICLLCLVLPSSLWADNALRDHPSPYLALHGQDSIEWQPWSAHLLEQAQQSNKILFVSIGYFSCHWCHVMHRESFQDPTVASLLNKHFIAVKVDRELNPELDAQLIEFVSRYRGHAGWPLNVFVTPEGFPFIGGVYFPRDQFISLLTRIADQWRTDKAKISNLAKESAAQWSGATELVVEPLDLRAMHRLFVESVVQQADEVGGGFGQQSKFPMVAQLSTLLTLIESNEADVTQRDFLILTLDRMHESNLRDHLGGGFFRYTVDPTWNTPHFEKMLYDNVQLAELYLRAGNVLHKTEYLEVAADTLNFLIREMRDKSGGFFASLSALDGEGKEGGFYLWKVEELRAILQTEELNQIRGLWRLDSPSSFEFGYLPTRLQRPQSPGLAAIYSKLAARRHDRSLPIDKKLIAGWNGLTLRAYALASTTTLPQAANYRRVAEELSRFLRSKFIDKNGELAKSIVEGKHYGQGTLEDYAYVVAGMSTWGRVASDRSSVQLSHQLVARAWSRFLVKDGFSGNRDRLPVPGNDSDAWKDAEVPAAAVVLLQSVLTDKQLKDKYLTQISNLLKKVSGRYQEYPFAHASLVNLHHHQELM